MCRGGRTDDSLQLCSEITARGRQDDLGQWSTKGLKEIGMYVYIWPINREVIFTFVLVFFQTRAHVFRLALNYGAEDDCALPIFLFHLPSAGTHFPSGDTTPDWEGGGLIQLFMVFGVRGTRTRTQGVICTRQSIALPLSYNIALFKS